MNVETPADIACEVVNLILALGNGPAIQTGWSSDPNDWAPRLEARIIRAVRIQDIIQAQGPLQPGQVVAPQLKCPHCHSVMGRWMWLTTPDGKARVHYCEMCSNVLNVEAIG